jgi:hypothetical protein
VSHKIHKLTKREATVNLRTFILGKGYRINNFREWRRWETFTRPFWSVWVIVYYPRYDIYRFWGIHIYDDGEVLLVHVVLPEPDF